MAPRVRYTAARRSSAAASVLADGPRASTGFTPHGAWSWTCFYRASSANAAPGRSPTCRHGEHQGDRPSVAQGAFADERLECRTAPAPLRRRGAKQRGMSPRTKRAVGVPELTSCPSCLSRRWSGVRAHRVDRSCQPTTPARANGIDTPWSATGSKPVPPPGSHPLPERHIAPSKRPAFSSQNGAHCPSPNLASRIWPVGALSAISQSHDGTPRPLGTRPRRALRRPRRRVDAGRNITSLIESPTRSRVQHLPEQPRRGLRPAHAHTDP